MYGIINSTIESLVTENYGEAVWNKVKNKSEEELDIKDLQIPDDDMRTFRLAIATAEVLGISINEVLFKFGEYWVISIGLQYYSLIMQTDKNNLREFLFNLPKFYKKVMLMCPNIAPPDFKVIDKGNNKVEIHNYSSIKGLAYFMNGLISGMGKAYKQSPEIQLKKSRIVGRDHEEFAINW